MSASMNTAINAAVNQQPSPVSRDHQLQSGLRSASSGNLNAPQFSEVMNLVQPKIAQEAVRAYEAHAEPREVSQESSKVEARRELKSPERVERAADERDAHAVASSEESSDVGALELNPQRQAKLLKLINQLSREDLTAIMEWRGDLGLQAGALDTQLNLQNLPKVDGITTSDMMALLNGFKELRLDQVQLPQLDGPQLAQMLESQWALARGQIAHRGIGAAPVVQDMSAAQLNAPINPAALNAMTPVARPAEVMPALEVLRLSQSQKEGILKQVAKGFKAQAKGTQSVNIRLHPEELGAVRLKVEVQGQDVRVFFSAENAVVNDLISQNLDELKALLLEKDFNLTEAGVFQEQLQHQGERHTEEDEGEDYGSDERPDLKHRPRAQPKLSPLPNRFRATI